MKILTAITALFLIVSTTAAQDETLPAETELPISTETESVEDPPSTPTQTEAERTSLDDVGNQAKELASQTKEKVGELAETLDKTEAAQEVSAGVLKPIYQLADSLSFPGFYWVAFMLMVAGSISYALQLVFGKVVVLSKGSMNVREILSDSIALAICLIGLVLTTQAATQNSSFSSTPSAVLSATTVGAILGLCLYRWGQAEEVDAARGRKAAKSKKE